jgi:glucosamine--fructose-6-phosphate aminotransferase (isomerizing)
MLTDTNLYREINEQPAAVGNLLSRERQAAAALARAIREAGISHVVIAARGTSDNAARYGQYVLGARNGLTVALATPSLFSIYGRPPGFDGALVVGISQSGRSPDIIAVLAEARRQGALTSVITNTPDSQLARLGDHVIDLGAGEERSVAATKTYTTELAAIALLSATLAGDGHFMAELEAMPEVMAATLGMSEMIARIAPRYCYMQRCVVIGRGFNYATAFELALKMKELTYTIVEPYSSADFLHGPMALIEEGFPVIVIAPTGALLGKMTEFVDRLGEHGAETILISDDEPLLARARIPLQLPRTTPEWLSPLVTILPGQLLALHLAHERGHDVDAPRSIRKVTETQ